MYLIFCCRNLFTFFPLYFLQPLLLFIPVLSILFLSLSSFILVAVYLFPQFFFPSSLIPISDQSFLSTTSHLVPFLPFMFPVPSVSMSVTRQASSPLLSLISSGIVCPYVPAQFVPWALFPFSALVLRSVTVNNNVTVNDWDDVGKVITTRLSHSKQRRRKSGGYTMKDLNVAENLW